MTGAKISAKTDGSPAVGTMMMPIETAGGAARRLPLSSLFLLLGYENAVTAHAGGGQGSAQTLSTSARIHRVSVCATAGDSIKFGADVVVNEWHFIRNDGATAVQIYGFNADTINGVTASTGVSLDPGHGAFFLCSAAGNIITSGLLGVTAATIAAIFHAATGKTTPVDADELGLIDSAASNVLKKLTWANLKATFIGTVNLWTAAQRSSISTLTDAATVALDLSLSNYYKLIIGGNRTLGAPTNAVAGQSFVIRVQQPAAGSKTLAYAWCYQWDGGSAGVLSTAGCSRDTLIGSVDVSASSTVTITIATPGVVTWNSHGLEDGQPIQLTTTGALPTGLAASTTYWVTNASANSFSLSTTLVNAAAGTKIATSGSQSGVHTMTALSISLSLRKAQA